MGYATAGEEVPHGFYVPYALDPDHAERLWTLSETLIALSAVGGA